MKLITIGIVVSLSSVALSQAIPTETEALKRPTFQTGGSVLIKNGRLLTVTRGFLDGYDLLIRNGKIAQIGKDLSAPAGVKVIDVAGRFVSPGIVDAHSHRASDDTNEGANAISSETRILDVLNPNQPNLFYGLASGMTTSLVLHGSANPIGGQSLVIKNKWMRPAHEVVFQGAPKMIKFALGENPKSDPSQPNPRFPATRMGVEAIIRRGFADARQYMRDWDEYAQHRGDARVAPPRRDLRLEGLAEILQGKTWVQCHSYRQDEMLMIARLSQELGFKLVLQHALESYKIAPELAKAKVPVSIFGGGFAYKLEVVDSIPMAAAILDKAGVLISVNTDTFSGTVPLTQDAARSMRYGVSEDRALRMVTLNPAKQLGVDSRVGSLEVGKDGDVAIWQGHPLSVYTKCAMTLIEGEVFFERRDLFKIDAKSMSQQSPRVNAHDPGANAPLPFSTSYLIAGGTVHPVSGPTQTNSNVLIENDRIVAVGPGVRGKKGTVTVNAKGMHVFPGFINAGARPGLDEIGQIPQAMDARENGDFKPDLRAINSINPESQHLPKAFTHGITTLLEMPVGGMISGQAGLVNTFGSTNEELAVDPLAGLVVNVPAGVDPRFRDQVTPEELKRMETAAKDRLKRLTDYFAAARTYLEARDAGEGADTDIKLEAMRPYLNGSRPIYFVANSVSAIRNALACAKQFKLKSVIVGGADAWKVAKQLKDANVPVIYSAPSIQCPDSDAPQDSLDPYDTPFAAAEVLRSHGVKFALQTNDYESVFNLPNQAGRLCAYGLPWNAAIRALTLDAAQILGVGDRLGSLEVGKIANVVITDGDPLEITTQVRQTFISGRPLEMASKYTELHRKYMKRLGNL